MPETSLEKLEDFKTPVNLKIALLWASVVFLYIYNDYFSLYVSGTIEAMSRGSLGPMGQATDALLVGLSLMLAVPSLMIFLSASLAPPLSRWLNVVVGGLYTVVEVLTLFGTPLFYKIVVVLEIMLTSLIILHALRWPRRV